jgi:rod shape-determining protein MreD
LSTYLALPVMALAATVQASLGARLTVLGVHADLVLVIALAWGLVRGVRQGLLWMAVGALFLDLLYNGPFGVNLFAATPVALLALVTEANLFASAALLPLGAMAAGSVFYHVIVMLLLTIAGARYDWPYMLVAVILPATLVNTLLLPVFYWPMRGLRAWLLPVARPPAP